VSCEWISRQDLLSAPLFLPFALPAQIIALHGVLVDALRAWEIGMLPWNQERGCLRSEKCVMSCQEPQFSTEFRASPLFVPIPSS
jgi:hypothetical protein